MRLSTPGLAACINKPAPTPLSKLFSRVAMTVAVASLAACASVGGGGSGAGFYRIERGDTLGTIARSHGIPLLRLTRLNPNLHPDRISTGEQIRMPQSGERAPGSGPYRYRIRGGDTLGSLASEFSTSTAAIQRANPGLSPGNLTAGKLIKLPHGRVSSSNGTATAARSQAPVYRLPSGVSNWSWPLANASVKREWGTNSSGTIEPMLLTTQGSPIARADAAGSVSFASSMRQLGNVVVLHHAHNMQSVYAQCGTLHVQTGQHIAKGAPLCNLAAQGELLFDVRYKGNPVNPRRVLEKQ